MTRHCVRCGRPDNHAEWTYPDCLHPVIPAGLSVRALTKLLRGARFAIRDWPLWIIAAGGLIAFIVVVRWLMDAV